MHDRHRKSSDSRAQRRIERRSVDSHTIGVGPVKHHELLAIGRSRFHKFGHSDIVGVISKSYILNITHYNVYILQRRRRKRLLLPRPIKRAYRQTGAFISGIAHLGAGIGSASEAMLRCIQNPDIDPGINHHIECMAAVGHYSGMIAE